MKSEPETLTLSQVNVMSLAARDGRAHDQNVRKLLTLFCQCVEHGLISARGNQAADCLLEYVREALRAFLNGSRPGDRGKRGLATIQVRSIEAAFGLVHRRGHPEADEDRQIQMAASVWRHRFAGETYEKAVLKAADEFNREESATRRAWRTHRTLGLARIQQDRDWAPWTDAERDCIRKSLGGGIKSPDITPVTASDT